MADRIVELDVARAFAIILIIFSHIPTQIDPAIKFWTAIIGVSLFLFISGIVLHYNDGNLLRFYKKRARRIYPLYWVVVGVYVAIQYGWPSVANTLNIYLEPWQIVVNAAGLQGLLNVPSYGVLWFVGVILVYYAIYPSMANRPAITVVAWSAALMALMYALHLLGLIIPEMIYYWPVFVAGVLVSKRINAD